MSTARTNANSQRDSPMLVVYMKPRVRGQRTTEQDNYEKIQQDIELQKRFGNPLSTVINDYP
jgi:hypothetical protein